MRRYQGEGLSKGARIAVVSNDALGNYAVVTPLLKLLRTTYPDCTLHYYGGERTRELWDYNPDISAGFALFGTPPGETARRLASPYDLVINVEDQAWAKSFAAMAAGGAVVGPCLDMEGRKDLPYEENERGQLWQDKEWISPELTSRYPFLQSGFIAELFCRLAYLDGPLPPYQLASCEPEIEVPDLLIATAASLDSKLWPREKWSQALREIGGSVGLLGAPPAHQRRYWQGDQAEDALVAEGLVTDLRGKLSLRQVVGALSRAKAVLTLDNGILHLASSTATPIVGLFRHGIHRLWAPPAPNLTVLTPGPDRAVSEIEVSDVVEAIRCAKRSS